MEIIEMIASICFTILIGGIAIGSCAQIWQELNFRKRIHDKEMEKLNFEILRLEQQIADGDKITQETIKQLRGCTRVI